MASSESSSIKQYAQKLVVIKCDVCDEENENDAVHYCRECNQYLCVSCERFHRKFQKDHKLITPFQGREIERLNLALKCFNHSKKFSFYCENCGKNICKLCFTNHAGHKLINIDKHAEMLKTDLLEQVNKLQQILPGIKAKSDVMKNHLSYFDKLIYEQISLVETQTEKIRTALETQSAKLIQDLKKEQETAHDMLTGQINTVDDHKQDIQCLTTSIKAQIDIAPDAGMLQLFNDAKTKLDSKSNKITLTLPNPSTFTPVSLGDQLLVGTTNNTGNTYLTIDMVGDAPDTQTTSKKLTERSHTPVDPLPSLRRELSVLHKLSLDPVVSCTTEGSSCWVGVYTDRTSGEVQLVNKHGEQLLTVELPHRVNYTALTSTGDLLVSGYNTTKITRVTRQGETRAFVDIKARGVKCVSGLCTTQQDDVFVCVTMTDDKTKDKVIKMSAQGEQILQDGWGDHRGSRLVIIDAGGQLLRHINRPGELQTVTWDITGDRHGHIIAGTVTYGDVYIHAGTGAYDEYIRVCSGEGACIHTYKLPRSWRICSLSVGEDDVMWVATWDRRLIVAKYLE